MSGKFNSGSLTNATNLGITGFPCTFAGWYYLRSTALTDTNFFSLSDGTTTNMLKSKVLRGSGANNCIVVNSTLTNATRVTYNGKWVHLALVFTSTTSRTVYMDGKWQASNATSLTPTGFNQFSIGSAPNEGNFTGWIEDFGAWDIALTTAQVRQLARSSSPSQIAAANLKGYFCAPGYSPVIDLSGNGNTLTRTAVRYDAFTHYPTRTTLGRSGSRLLTSTAQIDDAAISANAVVAIAATSTAQIDDAAITATATAAINATSSAQISDSAISATATAAIAITSTAQIADAAISASAVVSVTATSTAQIDDAAISALATASIAATSTARIDDDAVSFISVVSAMPRNLTSNAAIADDVVTFQAFERNPRPSRGIPRTQRKGLARAQRRGIAR